MSDKPLNEDIHYLNGQIDALTALVLAIAGSTMDRVDFVERAHEHLDRVESMVMASPVPDARLQGIDAMRQWVDRIG